MRALKYFALLGVISFSGLCAYESSDHIKFVVELRMDCPPSSELQACIDSIPTKQSETFEEWRSSLLKNLKSLIVLLESGKIHAGQWSVEPDPSSTRPLKNHR